MKLFPFNSSEGHTRAGELIALGAWAFSTPGDDRNQKPSEFPIEELLFNIGFAQAQRNDELQNAHEAIPEAIAPRGHSTTGVNASLADRVAILLARLETAEGALRGLQAAACDECGSDLAAMDHGRQP